MKIIGESANGFIIDASKDELAKLKGFGGAYDSDFKRLDLRPGISIDIAKAAGTAAFIRGLDTDKLADVADSLQRAMDQVKEATESVQAINLIERLQEDYDEE